MNRRDFLKNAGLSLCAMGVPLLGRKVLGAPSHPLDDLILEEKTIAGIPEFTAPKEHIFVPVPERAHVSRVVLVRYGGGVRLEETIDPKTTESPFLYYNLLKEGTLYSNVWIDRKSITGHAQGSLYLMTGRFDPYSGGPFDIEYIPHYPTLSEYVRKSLGGDPINSVIINNSDNMSTEFFGFSQHQDYGIQHGPVLLSEWVVEVRRFKRKIALAKGNEKKELQKKLHEKEKLLFREIPQDPRIISLVDRLDKEFREHIPLGDELVAELAIRALEEFNPAFLQIHLQDSDYVHWGPPQLYRRGVRRMDLALERIWHAIQLHPKWRDETALVVVPDHGRNINKTRRIPYQHHDTEDPGSHRVFAFFAGPGIPRDKRIDESRPQIDVTPTIGKLLGIATPFVQGRVLEGVFV